MLVEAARISSLVLVNTPNELSYVGDIENGDVVVATHPPQRRPHERERRPRNLLRPPRRRRTTEDHRVRADEEQLRLRHLPRRRRELRARVRHGASDDRPLGDFTLLGLTPGNGAELAVTLRSPTPAAAADRHVLQLFALGATRGEGRSVPRVLASPCFRRAFPGRSWGARPPLPALWRTARDVSGSGGRRRSGLRRGLRGVLPAAAAARALRRGSGRVQRRGVGRAMTKQALLAGATGLVGGELAKQLSASGEYAAIHVLVRRSVPALASMPKLVLHVIDFDELPALPATDDVYIALGTTIKVAGSEPAFRRVDHDYVVGVARAARARVRDGWAWCRRTARLRHRVSSTIASKARCSSPWPSSATTASSSPSRRCSSAIARRSVRGRVAANFGRAGFSNRSRA